MYNELLKNGGFSEFAGLSTDEKPVNGRLSTGSTFTEVDTGDVYMYDAEDASWTKQFSLQSSGGGGGGGGGASGMVVEFAYDETGGNYRFVSSTPAADVVAAFSAGTPVVFYIPGTVSYGVKECYIKPTAYSPEQEYYGETAAEQFETSTGYVGNIANSFTVDASGYLEATIFVD